MRTTLNIDDDVLQAAMKFSKGRTKTEVINEALARYVRSKRRKELLRMQGKVEWVGEIDKLRKRS